MAFESCPGSRDNKSRLLCKIRFCLKCNKIYICLEVEAAVLEKKNWLKLKESEKQNRYQSFAGEQKNAVEYEIAGLAHNYSSSCRAGAASYYLLIFAYLESVSFDRSRC